MSKVLNDSEDIYAGIGIFFKIFNKFSCNLRSTLTSSGPIVVKKSSGEKQGEKEETYIIEHQ
jgi:hypothetical protein